MASNDHLKLSNIIKNVHEDLRRQTSLLGTENAWKSHCSNENTLKLYATAMKDLAVNHWEANETKWNRIYWTATTCFNYFTSNIMNCRLKEQQEANKINIVIDHDLELPKNGQTWKLLDVGSCYNPFKQFDYFEVVPVDIAPGSEEVYKCDFLAVSTALKIVHTANQITELPQNYFDVIVFSLLLEYLPSPEQRQRCCRKAYDVLKTEGLLIIITPDSNHVGSNAQLMKSWRFILAEMGFTRIKYEKLPHIHCMAFRKSFDKILSRRWADLHRKQQVYSDMFIPQDFNTEKLTDTKFTEGSSEDEEKVLDFLNELPFGVGE